MAAGLAALAALLGASAATRSPRGGRGILETPDAPSGDGGGGTAPPERAGSQRFQVRRVAQSVAPPPGTESNDWIDDLIEETDLPPAVQEYLREEADAAARAAVKQCIEITGDAELCALAGNALKDPAQLKAFAREAVGKGAAAACSAYGVPGPLCEKAAEWAFDKAYTSIRGRQYRRPLYRYGMARIVKGVNELQPGEYLMTRDAISKYTSKIRVGQRRYETGQQFHAAEPRSHQLAIKSQLLAIAERTATGQSPEIEKTLDIPSDRCIAVPVTMGPTWMRDRDGTLRKTLAPPPGLTGFDVSPIKRTNQGLASFPGWVNKKQP